MESNDVVGEGKAFVQSIFEHGFCTSSALLCRLGNKHYGTPPSLALLEELLGRAHPYRHMDVVSAGVHDSHFFTVRGFDAYSTCIRGSCLFDNGQGIHIGAHHDGRSVAIAQYGHHTGASNALGYF